MSIVEPAEENGLGEGVEAGCKIRFSPNGGRRWWTVRARDERYIVATCQAPFETKGNLWYTVVDLTGWQSKRYNGAGNGVVRSSLNTLGGGWDLTDDGIDQIRARVTADVMQMGTAAYWLGERP